LKASLLSVLFCLAIPVAAQHWELVDSMKVNLRITAVSVDPQSQLYLGCENGEIVVFDAGGNEKNRYLFPGMGVPSLIDAWNPLRPFVFFQDTQQYLYLDRFTVNPRVYSFKTMGTTFVSLAAPGMDNSLWTLQLPGFELKKRDQTTLSEILNIPLRNTRQVSQISQFKSYRNLLILTDLQLGLLLYDQFGNVLRSHPDVRSSHIQVYQDSIYAYDGTTLYIVPAFENKKREAIPAPTGYNYALAMPGYFLFIGEQQVDRYILR